MSLWLLVTSGLLGWGGWQTYENHLFADHAQFRQYGSTQGRWMRPDPYSGSYDLSNPQSLDRYVYAVNNPLSYIDPSGLTMVCIQAGGYTYINGDFGSSNFFDDVQVCTDTTAGEIQGLRAAAVVAVVPQVTGYRKLLSNVRQRP